MTLEEKPATPINGPASAEPASNFRVSSTTGQIEGVTFYFIESTAPDNVEQPPTAGGLVDGLTPINPDDAVRQIAQELIPQDPEIDASLVVMVHGFNNPRENVLEFYRTAIEALEKDKAAIFDKKRKLVCVGYRWPSESMGSVLSSTFKAMPLFPFWLVIGAGAVLLLRLWSATIGLPAFLSGLAWLLTFPAIGILAVALVVALLRGIVYFRDIYRATNYGVPDLVEVIRQIDLEASALVNTLAEEKPRQRIALSFIGHSMGGLVVTNAIRVLSDVFDPEVIRTDLSGRDRRAPASEEAAGLEHVPGRIGHVFALMRFVLASPDIPAETLLADRGNFLASALRRFREAYLFSNEGDEVLRMISTTANYFSFPTQSRNYGYRLGNLDILSSNFGLAPRSSLLNTLRVGCKTLADLSIDTRHKGKHAMRKQQEAAEIADAFTYFDCTDYVDGPQNRGLLTEAINYKAKDAKAKIPYLEHIKLLWKYAWPFLPANEKINVHGGYFEGDVTQRLIYRLACLGFEAATNAYGDEEAMLQECAQHQIRVMVSQRLHAKLGLLRSREPMKTDGGATRRFEKA